MLHTVKLNYIFITCSTSSRVKLIIILYATGCLAFLTAAKLSYPVTVLPIAGHDSPEGGAEVLLYPFFNLRARWWCVVNAMPLPP